MTNDDATMPVSDPDGGPAFPKWLKWGLIGALAVLVLGYGAIFLYAKVINDSPDELDESDLDAALSIDDTTPEPAEEPAAEPAADDTDDEPAAETTAPADPPATTTAPADEAPAGAGVAQARDRGTESEVTWRRAKCALL